MKLNKTIIIFLFFLTSFLGWVVETIGSFIAYGQWVDRGLLTLPFCPIYGICVTFIFIVLKAPSFGYITLLYEKYRLEGNKVKLITLYASYAVLFGMICGIAEYFTGLFIDTFGMKKLWDYQGNIDSIDGYVRLSYVFLFGLFGMLYMKYIYSNIYKKLYYKNNKNIQIINIVLFVFLFIDILGHLL